MVLQLLKWDFDWKDKYKSVKDWTHIKREG